MLLSFDKGSSRNRFIFFINANLAIIAALANSLTFTFAQKFRTMDADMQNQTENPVTENFDINSDENIRGTSHLNNEMNDEGEMEKLNNELEEQKDKYLRLVAEFDNFKRRNAKERMELIQTAGREVITSMLDVLDDCERAEKQIQSTTDIAQIKEGVQLVFNKLRTTLQSKGLKPMESIHTDFDVEKHEAITEIPAPNEELIGKVLDDVTKGYYLNDKLIRFAKVVIGK